MVIDVTEPESQIYLKVQGKNEKLKNGSFYCCSTSK